MFTENSTTGNFYIVKSIKQHSLIPHTCCHNCGLTDWLNGKLTLELDHINGSNNDNRLENLRFLCPNCHSQTTNYKGKNINTGKVKVSDQELRDALKTENNIRKALIKVGLSPKGANYKRAYKLKE
jgi:5-methylcytosine-specific restriction endonuclease McrA